MKIEMGESLFLSWLRHVKQCQIVQLNWKPSNSWDLANEERIVKLLRVFRDFFDSKYHIELFGKESGQNHSQILKQGEIDALGLRLKDKGIDSVYAIDVAFHEGGLNYGTREKTVCRVTKKLVRTAMIILGYFGIDKGEIIFASPKISPKTFDELGATIKEVSGISGKYNLNFKFRLFGNEVFKKEAMVPVIERSGEVADTSELFMRSVQLCQLFDIIKKKPKPTTDNAPAEAGTEEKIGQFARRIFNQLFSGKKMTQEMLESLQDATYSKKTFHMAYPILKKIDPNKPEYEQWPDNKLRARYWSPRWWSQECDNGRCLLCSQWFERHRGNLTRWASQFE